MTEREDCISSASRNRTGVEGLKLLRRRMRIMVLTTFLGLTIGVAYYLLSPEWYEAEIMIVPKDESINGLGSVGAMLGQLPFDVGGASSLGTDAERISAILKSRSTTDAVIEKFSLIDRYETENIENARKQVWSVCSTEVERKPNLVVLRCEDKDPVIARDIAEFFGQVGDEGFRRIATSSASEERKFLGQRAKEAKRDLDNASLALRQFQETHKILDLPEQSKAVVSAMATLEGDLISKRVQLAYLSGFASSDEASASQLVRQIDIIRHELLRLERQRNPAVEPSAAARMAAASAGSDLFPPAMNVPALRYELENLFREQKIRETVFFLLTERYESLKVDEARDLSTFVVFDHAALPTHRIRPRLRVVAIGTIVGLVFGFMLIIMPGWWRDLLHRAAVERSS